MLDRDLVHLIRKSAFMMIAATIRQSRASKSLLTSSFSTASASPESVVIAGGGIAGERKLGQIEQPALEYPSSVALRIRLHATPNNSPIEYPYHHLPILLPPNLSISLQNLC